MKPPASVLPPAGPRPAQPGYLLRCAAASLALIAAAAYAWRGWCVFPLWSWNEMRLAPTFALLHGVPVYPLREDGPLSTWIYGPVALVLNLPATLAPSAVGALEIAGLINLATLLAPLALVCCTTTALPRGEVGARVFAFATAILLLPPSSLALQVADHAAIAFGIASCWLLARPANLTPSVTACAAACCVLSVGAKQTSLFLVGGLLIFLGRDRPRHDLVRFVAYTAAFGGAVALLWVMQFGAAGLWLNLVEIPRRLPLSAPVARLASQWGWLAAYVAAPIAIFTLARCARWWPKPDGENGRMTRCACIVFVTLLPVGLFSFLKIGGATNSIHSAFYILPLFAIVLARSMIQPRRIGWAFLVVATLIAIRTPELRHLPRGPITEPLEQAAEIARRAPSAAWFPQNPLVTFYSDHELYTVEDGVSTRYLAGLAIDESAFRRHLPSDLGLVVYPANAAPFAIQLLPEFRESVRSAHWTVYQR